MSMVMCELDELDGIVGASNQCLEPTRPISSPSQNANRIERRVVRPASENASMVSNSTATPLALSSAPLWMLPIGP